MFKPDAVAVEELFFNTNITTGISVAHGRGVILLAGEMSGVPMFEYTPLQVKQAITGYGRADKGQRDALSQDQQRRHQPFQFEARTLSIIIKDACLHIHPSFFAASFAAVKMISSYL